jgi:hypothetical protein
MGKRALSNVLQWIPNEGFVDVLHPGAILQSLPYGACCQVIGDFFPIRQKLWQRFERREHAVCNADLQVVFYIKKSFREKF